MKIRKAMEDTAFEHQNILMSLAAQQNKIVHVKNGITVMKLIATA